VLLAQINGSHSTCDRVPTTHRTYKSTVGAVACSACPAGTTTPSGTRGATSVADCSTCKPGYGGWAAGSGGPSCTICAIGTWSGGLAPGGPGCTACPQAQQFTGRMVTRQARPPLPSPPGRQRQGGCWRAEPEA
jgi:hypothetical protein